MPAVQVDDISALPSIIPVALDVLLLGGRPIGEPISWYGPFVMTTHDEIVQAIEDYQAGRMGQIPVKQH